MSHILSLLSDIPFGKGIQNHSEQIYKIFTNDVQPGFDIATFYSIVLAAFIAFIGFWRSSVNRKKLGLKERTESATCEEIFKIIKEFEDLEMPSLEKDANSKREVTKYNAFKSLLCRRKYTLVALLDSFPNGGHFYRRFERISSNMTSHSGSTAEQLRSNQTQPTRSISTENSKTTQILKPETKVQEKTLENEPSKPPPKIDASPKPTMAIPKTEGGGGSNHHHHIYNKPSIDNIKKISTRNIETMAKECESILILLSTVLGRLLSVDEKVTLEEVLIKFHTKKYLGESEKLDEFNWVQKKFLYSHFKYSCLKERLNTDEILRSYEFFTELTSLGEYLALQAISDETHLTDKEKLLRIRVMLHFLTYASDNIRFGILKKLYTELADHPDTVLSDYIRAYKKQIQYLADPQSALNSLDKLTQSGRKMLVKLKETPLNHFLFLTLRVNRKTSARFDSPLGQPQKSVKKVAEKLLEKITSAN